MDFDMHRSETKMQHFKLSDPNDFVAHILVLWYLSSSL